MISTYYRGPYLGNKDAEIIRSDILLIDFLCYINHEAFIKLFIINRNSFNEHKKPVTYWFMKIKLAEVQDCKELSVSISFGTWP